MPSNDESSSSKKQSRDLVEEINTTKGDVRILRDPMEPLAADYVIQVSGENWEMRRYWFFNEFELKEAKSFGTRLLYNPEFRQKSRRREAQWTQIHDTYLKAEEKAVEPFFSRDLFDYSLVDFEAEMKAKRAKVKLQLILEEIYCAISRVIGEFSLSPKDLQPYLDKQFEAARGVAAMIDDPDDVPLENIRSEDRWLECRGEQTNVWRPQDAEHDDIPRIVEIYSGKYEPVAALVVPDQLHNFVKDQFDWETTHRSWSEERECWEIDLNSVEYVVELFTECNIRIRISDPVARICDRTTPRRPSPIRPKRELPTMILFDQKYGSMTDFLILPGVQPDQVQDLIQKDLQSLNDLARTSVDDIDGNGNLSNKMARTLIEGAQAAIGDREPAAVTITKETRLGLSEAQKAINGLAASGNPPSKITCVFLEMSQSNLIDFESISNRGLYYLYEAGFRSTSDLLAADHSEVADTYLISPAQAKSILAEANKYDKVQ